MSEQDIREECARLVEDTAQHMGELGKQAWVRLALALAARAIRRGRHLTVGERLENLSTALEDVKDAD